MATSLNRYMAMLHYMARSIKGYMATSLNGYVATFYISTALNGMWLHGDVVRWLHHYVAIHGYRYITKWICGYITNPNTYNVTLSYVILLKHVPKSY